MRTMVGVLDRLMADVAEGMAYIYKAGVEHRDLKSDNCLVTHDWRAKVGAALVVLMFIRIMIIIALIGASDDSVIGW